MSITRRSRTRSTKTAVSKLVLATFPELNQAFDVGERLTLPLPVSFDPVKGVDLIFQLPWRKLSRGCIFDKNAHTTQCFEKMAPHVLTASNCSQLISAFKYLGSIWLFRN